MMRFMKYVKKEINCCIIKLQGQKGNSLRVIPSQTGTWGQTSESGVAKIILTTQHILDSYGHLTPLEKNNLWKIVLEKITVYRPQNGELSIHIYPKTSK